MLPEKQEVCCSYHLLRCSQQRFERGQRFSVPLETEEKMLVDWMANAKAHLSAITSDYIAKLKQLISE